MKSYNYKLENSQINKVLEMLQYIFPTSSTVEHSFTEENQSGNFKIGFEDTSKTSKSYVTCSILEALLFVIPTKLGMDFMYIDPERPESLFQLVEERFNMVQNIPEKSDSKPLHLIYGYYDQCFGGCE